MRRIKFPHDQAHFLEFFNHSFTLMYFSLACFNLSSFTTVKELSYGVTFEMLGAISVEFDANPFLFRQLLRVIWNIFLLVTFSVSYVELWGKHEKRIKKRNTLQPFNFFLYMRKFND